MKGHNMQIHVQLFGGLRDYLPLAQRGKATLQFSEGATVHDVLLQLGIRIPVIVNINETNEVEPAYPVQDGDKLLVVGHSSGG